VAGHANDVQERFPTAPGLPKDIWAYLKRVEYVYATDAYHLLLIEGYQVSPEFFGVDMHSGDWHPAADETDREHSNALVARRYWQAFQRVEESVKKVLGGANPGQVADEDHGAWYRQLFTPSVTAGLPRPADLACYRNGPVYIRCSMHVPPAPGAVRDAMPTLFDLLREEPEPAVRVELGHFIFVYIHPYTDGNGRMGRFLMNLMLAAGSWDWTVIPAERRATYMAALEAASVREGIGGPFADFLAGLVGNDAHRR